ncbi:MAG: hypothetical protein H6710_23775 [Myxococcales bacterium]|nr:hypothetical protein [Myxococcales bacterium]MCB9700808.1 hypothetical protein [Myxococcales bacterium]
MAGERGPKVLPATAQSVSTIEVQASSPQRPSAEEVRQFRHLLAVTITAGVTLGLLLFVAFRLLDAWRRGDPPATAVASAASLECEDGECLLESQTIPRCGDGDTCDAEGAQCLCLAPMRCVDRSCNAPPKEPPVCTDPEVRKLLSELSVKCKGNFDTCPEDDLQNFAISSATFDSTLARFDNSITVHFNHGTPPLDDRAWPPEEIRQHYLARLDTPRNREILEEAKVILMISRSSGNAQDKKNLFFSQVRGRFVRSLLGDLANTPDARSRIMPKVKSLPLGARKVLAVSDLHERLGNQVITWSAKTDRALRQGIEEYDSLGPSQQEWVRKITNQVTFIIPINCELPAAGQ